MGFVTGPITGPSSEPSLSGAAGFPPADSARSSLALAGPPGWPRSVMINAPAANRQAVKDQPKASPRPALDAKTPSAGSAAAAMRLLRIGMVTRRLTL